jgi:DNA-binding CsgD family transcriptional regulator
VARITLSPREQEVAALVAAGLTNRQIADRLFIAERTAEYHVEQIRNKLGFRSRVQIAGWFIEQEASGSDAPGNLPVQLTSFVGREREIVQVQRLLAENRLVSLAMFFSSGLAGGLAQKVDGKYLLVPGLLALAAGTGHIDWAAHADSSRWAFTPGLVVSGLGMGFVWTPVFSIATRDLPAHLGGVASGVVNTIQELGGVMASAVVGAFLQNHLTLAPHDQAVSASWRLPAEYQAAFVNGFSHAARAGLEVGAGQTGANLQLPAEI